MINKTYLIGRKFSKLTVIEWAERRKAQSLWKCQCECGNTSIVYYSALISGNTKTCGCSHGESHGQAPRGSKRTKEYRIWAHIKTRCNLPTTKDYKYYGARGIKICDEWANSFSAFFAYVGKCPDGLTLDRTNNDGNYEPGNVRWATRSEQNKNRRKFTRKSQ